MGNGRDIKVFLDEIGMDYELPPRVLESVTLMREKIIRTRALVSADSKVAVALEGIQKAINTFLQKVGVPGRKAITDLPPFPANRHPEYGKRTVWSIRQRRERGTDGVGTFASGKTVLSFSSSTAAWNETAQAFQSAP